MIRALRSFVSWLEKKFPTRVVVTDAEYHALIARVAKLEEDTKKLNNTIEVFMGFGGTRANPLVR